MRHSQRISTRWPAALAAAALTLSLAATAAPAEDQAPGATGPRTFTILHINDVYRIEGVDEGASGGLARVRTLRKELEEEAPDLLVLHAGDALSPSLLSHTYDGEQMVDVLNLLDGSEDRDPRMYAVFGNHEFDRHKLEHAAIVDARVEESDFQWLDTNVVWARGSDGSPLVEADQLVPSAVVESGGVRVGLFGLTTDLKHPEYVDRFEDPVATARQASKDLRAQGAEVVVGLTHLRMSEDLALLESLGPDGPDLILGGHEHSRQADQVQGRWVIKADAEARTASVVRVTLGPDGDVTVDKEFRTLDRSVAEDAQVRAAIDEWLVRHDERYCREVLEAPPGCLSEEIGKTDVTLVGEELEIRRFETNLGNWIADRALAAYASHGAQVAVLNSGSMRLNQDIPGGTPITRRHVEELFPFPGKLRLLKIRGRVLQNAVSHAVEDWTGNGWWLQVAGLAFRHDPANTEASGLTLLSASGPRRIQPEEEILLVTSSFLAQGGDGYCWNLGELVEGAPVLDLKELVIEELQRTEEEGISPEVEGRICNPERRGECLVAEEVAEGGP
ncbi:MAG: bifunctional metallophosphatase/5'-nucleotidase [Acidobacteriota bacterium]